MDDLPPTYSSAVLPHSNDTSDVTLELSDGRPTSHKPTAPVLSPAASFFEQTMGSLPSGLKISHASSVYANDTEYSFRDGNDSLLFSGQVEELQNGQKLIRFKNWERRTVFIIKLIFSEDEMKIEIYTQDGYQKIGTLINDLKSEESPSLHTITNGNSNTFYPIDQSDEDVGLKNSRGGLAATAHITSFYTQRAQRSGAVEVRDVQVALNFPDPSLSPYEKAAFLGWGLFWIILARMGEKKQQSCLLCFVLGFLLLCCVLVIIIVVVKRS